MPKARKRTVTETIFRALPGNKKAMWSKLCPPFANEGKISESIKDTLEITGRCAKIAINTI